MECQIVYSSLFKEWWQSLDINEKESILAYIDLLGMCGVKLSYPYCSKINDKTIKNKTYARIKSST